MKIAKLVVATESNKMHIIALAIVVVTELFTFFNM
ncbi:hypothetical protein VIOR3934_08556 [Vibrio orientalis CIP 102891 = ATCC 33934]|uniref:Uncharacterized protein n=1 Tax=Vibrio orientalis CIP 102891 = ATCC 33934 TaxID=675816 RepID=F9SPA7_VIBOR|nr:hypothetical protein VIOR3934_08556 [Vibrio orientalis CIP 102891 = ATCC 33934]